MIFDNFVGILRPFLVVHVRPQYGQEVTVNLIDVKKGITNVFPSILYRFGETKMIFYIDFDLVRPK